MKFHDASLQSFYSDLCQGCDQHKVSADPSCPEHHRNGPQALLYAIVAVRPAVGGPPTHSKTPACLGFAIAATTSTSLRRRAATSSSASALISICAEAAENEAFFACDVPHLSQMLVLVSLQV